MASPILTENDIFDIIYAMYEADTTNWGTTSEEYLSTRIMANAAINRWEFYEQTNWKELLISLTDAGDGDSTITAGTYTYDCPTDMIKPVSYVRTVSGDSSLYWNVVPVAKKSTLDKDSSHWCYFSGNIKAGFDITFNDEITLTTGDTISYEYYKAATKFAATTDTTEMADPYFIVYFVLSRFYENDGEDGKANKAFQEAESRLENMRTQNIAGMEFMDDLIGDNSFGFGV